MRLRLPFWLMGLAFSPYGFVNGFLFVAAPILLRADGISVEEIAGVMTVAGTPMFWAFLVAPVLDVCLSKSVYAVLCGLVAAASVGLAVLTLHHLVLFTALALLSYLAATVYGYSVQSWLTELMEEHHYGKVAASSNIANLGAGGLFGGLTVWLLRVLPLPLAAAALGLAMMTPMALMAWFPSARHPVKAAREVFDSFFGDLYRLCRRRRCRYGLLVFLLPVCSFALPFAAVGVEFHTSERWATLLNGPSAAVICSVGCLIAVPVCRWLSPRTTYVLTGLAAAAVTGTMMVAPRTMSFYIAGRLLYSLLQGVNFSAFSAALYEIVGRENPLRGTQLALLSASSNLPISYMTWLDGLAFGHFGVQGMLACDTFVAVAFCVPVMMFFARVRRLGIEEGEEPALAMGGEAVA